MERGRRVLLLAALCAGGFFVPFAVTWWLERSEESATSAQPAASAEVNVAYPTSGRSDSPTTPSEVDQESFEITPPPARPDNGEPVLIDQVREVIRDSFYLPVSDAALSKPSVGQIIEALGDPYTRYLPPSEFKNAQTEAASTYNGVGLLVGSGDSGLVVTSALRGPARAAGVRPGDVIVSIDGVSVETLAFERAIDLFQGERGSVATLVIRRPGELPLRTANVVRAEITSPAVRVRILNTESRDLGYIRLLSFPDGAGEQVRDATIELLEQGVKGIVLDLRGNPGGYLDEAVEVVSVFLRAGIVCSTDGLHRSPVVYTALGDAVAWDLPLVTLVDGQSASAAEIVAAAIRENKRGQVVGAATYGKASVQSVVPLTNGGGLRLTTATYLTPSGQRLAGQGVYPHVESVDDPLTRRDEAMRKARGTLAKLIDRRLEPPPIHF